MSFTKVLVYQVLHPTIESTDIITTRLVLDLYDMIQNIKIVGVEACKFLNFPEYDSKKFTSACFKLKVIGKRGKYRYDFLNQKFKFTGTYVGNSSVQNKLKKKT